RVPPAPGLDDVRRAERERDSVLLPARQVNGEGDPPEPAVPPEVMVGIGSGEVPVCLVVRHGVSSLREDTRRRGSAASDTSLPLPGHISRRERSGKAPWVVLPGCRARLAAGPSGCLGAISQRGGG